MVYVTHLPCCLRLWHNGRSPFYLLSRAFFAMLPIFSVAYLHAYQVNPGKLNCGPAAAYAPLPAEDSRQQGKIELEQNGGIQVTILSSNSKISFTLRNETSEDLHTIQASYLGLKDDKSQDQVGPEAWQAHDSPVPPNNYVDCSFQPTAIPYAGNYIGSLRVNAGSHEVSVPLVVRTRGPIWFGCYWIPLFLSCLVAMLGWSTSLALDKWYTIGLPRAQRLLSLRNLQQLMRSFLVHVEAWETRENTPVPNGKTRAAFDKALVDETISRFSDETLGDLDKIIAEANIALAIEDAFWTALQMAQASGAPGVLATRLDSVSRNQGPSGYRAALEVVLTTQSANGAPAPAAAAIAPVVFSGNLSNLTTAQLQNKIRTMDVVKGSVLAMLVLFSVYSVYYAANHSFGTLTDYIALFVWSLGLTTTGSQIISSIRVK